MIATLFCLWLLLSGVYKPLIIGFGIVTACIAVFVDHRMDRVDGDRLRYALNPFKFLGYLAWLMVEIAKSNISVTKVVLSKVMPIRQNLFVTGCDQKTELGQVIFANSITLTPGTITVETEDEHFWVHALTYCEDDHTDLADMGSRVAAIETGSV